MAEDVLGLLLPELSAETRAEVRRVVTALRLLRDDARVREARRVAPSWWSARRELERLERRQRWRAVEALLHSYLSALLPADSFLELGEPRENCASAWRILLAEPTPTRGFPPAPLESPVAVVERLIEAGVAHGASPAWRGLWTARARHVVAPPVEAERHWEAALRASEGEASPLQLRARLTAGLAAARLDRFEPRRALELLDTSAVILGLEPGLRRLLGWSALLCGQLERARVLLGHAAQPAPRLPRPLVELRGDLPEWAPLLQGAEACETPVQRIERDFGRREFGALVLGAFELLPGEGWKPLWLDAARGLRAAAQRQRVVPERAWPLLSCSEVRRVHAHGALAKLPEALAGEQARSLARTGLARPAGSPGCIHLESDHHLLPWCPRFLAQVQDWSRRREPRPAPVTVVGDRSVPIERPYETLDPRADFVEQLFARLALPPGWCACWIELDEHGAASIRSRRAPRSRLRELTPAAREAVQAAHLRREAVPFEEADSPTARGPARGVALPLTDRPGRRVLGLLVLVGEPAESLGERPLASARASLRALEALWWATAFRAHHLARTGDELAWHPAHRFLARIEPALGAAADSQAPLLLFGSPGSGRRTLARWLHFRGPASERGLSEGLEDRTARTRILEIESLDVAQQLELARAFAAGSEERILLLGRAPAHVLRERGLLSSELERRMDPLPLEVPPLRERRDEIPSLVRVLASNVARVAALARPRFSDEALAHLWRQDWRGGVPELASLVAQIVHAHGGRLVGAEEVRAALRARSLVSRERLPSLRPRALDLELALASTRHRVGSQNRSRAARYLGWDPETLEARLREVAPDGSRRAGRRKASEPRELPPT